MKTRDAGLFLLLAAFWGGSFVAIKLVVTVLPPVFGAALRVAVALGALGAWFRWEGRRVDVPGEIRRRMWLAGLFAQGFPFALLFWGEKRIAPGLAGILNGTVPLWTFLLGRAAGSTEPFTPRRAAGLALGFAGIAVICAPLTSFAGRPGELAGAGAVLLMAACYAVGSLLTRRLLSGAADFHANLLHQHCASAVFLLALSALLEPWPAPAALLASGRAIPSILYLGVCSTAIAFLIYFHLIRSWGAVRASAVTYVAPVFAVFWDYVFFGNALGGWELAGVAAILSGVVLLQRA